ncbi:MAG TPA: hypothetical protein VFR19_22925 [Hyphomicrobiaceae bacterium]|jgi:hypothetical protein|nr:hypothetical protein [Hyphomicrobiaceae bacterium]
MVKPRAQKACISNVQPWPSSRRPWHRNELTWQVGGRIVHTTIGHILDDAAEAFSKEKCKLTENLMILVIPTVRPNENLLARANTEPVFDHVECPAGQGWELVCRPVSSYQLIIRKTLKLQFYTRVPTAAFEGAAQRHERQHFELTATGSQFAVSHEVYGAVPRGTAVADQINQAG